MTEKLSLSISKLMVVCSLRHILKINKGDSIKVMALALHITDPCLISYSAVIQ